MSGTVARHWNVLRDSWAAETERRTTATRHSETRFLPAALEVMETPPNPLGAWLLWVLIALVGIAILWACLARVDVVAVAPGKLVATGHNKLVQAADQGVVRAIYVRDGQHVAASQALVALDPTTAGADKAQAEAALLSARIDAARGHALLDGFQGGPARFDAPPGTPPDVVGTQEGLIAARLAEVRQHTTSLEAQAEEARAQEAGSTEESRRLTDTLPLLAERVRRRGILADKGLSSKILQLELQQQQVDHERRIVIERETARRARASRSDFSAQAAQIRAEGKRDALTELAKAEADVRQRKEELTKANNRSGLQMLRAPVPGTVQQLAVYTEGAVLKPADPILVIVPDNARLIVEAKVLNRDIGFVRAGQDVMVKLDAYPFTRYGLLHGKIISISRDAVTEEKLGQVYEAEIALNETVMIADGHRERLQPGLTATAEIRTGTRLVINYLLSPLERRIAEAGRER